MNYKNLTITKEQCKISEKNRAKAKKYFNLPKGWVLHHEDETLRHNNIERYIEWRTEDLIPMSNADHIRLHVKLAKSKRSKLMSDEAKQKISEAHKGKIFSEEHKKKISESEKGKLVSDASKEKMRKAHIGAHWYNNGIIETQCHICPNGFKQGRLKKKKGCCNT